MKTLPTFWYCERSEDPIKMEVFVSWYNATVCYGLGDWVDDWAFWGNRIQTPTDFSSNYSANGDTYIPFDEMYNFILGKEEPNTSINNGGKTSYYELDPTWKVVQ